MALQVNKQLLKFIFILLLPVFFYIAVKILMHTGGKTVCIWKILTHHNCPGCGITRAFNALFEGRFLDAYNFNPKIVIVAPLMLFLWIGLIVKNGKNQSLRG